jgi:molybdopterin/thiamine biosynthesis adenylyltransferase
MDKNITRSRFKDAPWYPKETTSAIIGGAGGIGSWLTFLLARAGFDPIVYDYDAIESHNIGGQLFGIKHIGLPKVEAIKSIVKEFSDTDITVFNEAFDLDSMSHQYTFAAFDNMKARKDMFQVWYEGNSENPNAILIDGRLLMEQMQIFCVTRENAAEYKEEHLFDDSEVEAENCTMKQTSHSASMIASLMVGFFTNHVTNIIQGSVVRQVPFYHEYFIPINMTS